MGPSFLGHLFDLWVMFGFWGHPEIGTAITECFEHLDDEKHTYMTTLRVIRRLLGGGGGDNASSQK